MAEATFGYAEYARHGFFELVAASALLLPLLLLADTLHPVAVSKTVFRVVSGILVALLMVVMLSAAKRMHLYQSEYGLTELRFYVSAFMMMLAVLFLWFCSTVLCGNRALFAGGAFCIAALSIFALHAVNPDGWIARVNLARAEGKNFDAAYITTLSADAAPAAMVEIPKLTEKDRNKIVSALKKQISRDSDWRSWNWSRSQASRALKNVN